MKNPAFAGLFESVIYIIQIIYYANTDGPAAFI